METGQKTKESNFFHATKEEENQILTSSTYNIKPSTVHNLYNQKLEAVFIFYVLYIYMFIAV